MTKRAVEEPVADAAAVADAPRQHLLHLLRAAGAPLDAHELAASVGLHSTTVRFHLNVLRRAGLVHARPQPRAGTGRPRTVYSPAADPEPVGYQALAGVLAAHLADTAPQRAVRAERAGRAWAADLAATGGHGEQPPPSSQQVAQAVTNLFATLGFDPELGAEGNPRQIWLRACPFRATARAHPEVVCELHLGLLRGTLDEFGAQTTTAVLRPFVEPNLCAAQLGRADE